MAEWKFYGLYQKGLVLGWPDTSQLVELVDQHLMDALESPNSSNFLVFVEYGAKMYGVTIGYVLRLFPSQQYSYSEGPGGMIWIDRTIVKDSPAVRSLGKAYCPPDSMEGLRDLFSWIFNTDSEKTIVKLITRHYELDYKGKVILEHFREYFKEIITTWPDNTHNSHNTIMMVDGVAIVRLNVEHQIKMFEDGRVHGMQQDKVIWSEENFVRRSDGTDVAAGDFAAWTRAIIVYLGGEFDYLITETEGSRRGAYSDGRFSWVHYSEMVLDFRADRLYGPEDFKFVTHLSEVVRASMFMSMASNVRARIAAEPRGALYVISRESEPYPPEAIAQVREMMRMFVSREE